MSRRSRGIHIHWRYPLLRSTMRLLTFIVIGPRRLRIRGLENVPRRGPLIVVGNHVATLDPPLVGSRIPRLDVFYMTKSETFRTRWARFFLRGYNAFPVMRHTADRGAIETALRVLSEGHVLVMYPEGARSPDARLTRAFSGVGFLARRSGAQVVPVAIWGSEDVLPKGRYMPSRARVDVVYGEPFTVPERRPDGTRITNQQAADMVMARLAALLPEDYRGVYAGGALEETPQHPPAA